MFSYLSLRRVNLSLKVSVLICSIIIGLVLTREYSGEASSASTNERDLQRFVEIVRTLNAVAAERGPMNAVIAAKGDRPDLTERLTKSRSRADAGLARLTMDPVLALDAVTLRNALAKARSVVDGIAARPFEKRGAADIQQSVGAMLAIVDQGQSLVEETSHAMMSHPNSAIASQALIIRALSDLRDDAGRMGSALMVPLATARVIAPEERTGFDRAYGRVLEAHKILASLVTQGDPLLRSAVADVEAKFFGEAMAVYADVLEEGRDGRYEFDREGFTQKLQPSFMSLEALRDVVADKALRSVETDRQRARSLLIVGSAITLLMIGFQCILLVASQRLLFGPLLYARDIILALAAGEPGATPRRSRPIGEMGALFGALDTLSSRLQERDALDRHNTLLAQQLRDMADRDALTGLANRGALERAVGAMLASDNGGATVGLILFDIDHFKKINDAFGHRGGDVVLQSLARRWGARLGAEAILARFGGEEFAVVQEGATLRQMQEIAEQLRRETTLPVRLPSGTDICVTASFGVRVLRRGPMIWDDLVEGADAALYRAKEAGRNAVFCTSDDKPTLVLCLKA